MGLFDAFKKNKMFEPESFFADIESKVYDAIKKDTESIVTMLGNEEL